MSSTKQIRIAKRFLQTLAVALVPFAAATAAPDQPEQEAAKATTAPVATTAAGTTQPAVSTTAANDETVRLDAVSVEGADVGSTILPVRPNSAFYGFEELVQNTPRSIFQVSPTQLKTDHFHNFSDLARYSPSVSRGTSSNFSTFSKIRGGPADTTRDGILLLPAAVRPFNNNYWESVDIVAGVPSVIQGSTTRTAGVVNYVVKKPLFDGDHLIASFELGRVGLQGSTSYAQKTAQFDYNHVLIPNELAVRISLQKTDADQYWGNAKSDYYDIYAAITYKPFSKVTINSNFTYTDASGPMPYGINRIDQTLIDSWQYRSGLVVPTISYRFAGDTRNTTLYASRSEPGKFARSVSGPYNIDANTLGFTKETPYAVSYTQPADYNTKRVPIEGNQGIFSNKAFSDTTEIIGQNIIEYKPNEHYTIRNNTLFHYVDSYVHGNDGYHSYMINKMITSRLEFLTDNEIGAPGSWLQKLGVRHQSNSGYEFRYLWNYCDMVTGGNQNGNNQSAVNPADGGGNLGNSTLLGVPDIYAGEYYNDANGTLYQRILTPYGFWARINPNFYEGEGRYAGVAPNDTMLRINQLFQNNFFTEQKLSIWKFILRGGARITFINDFIKPNSTTDRAIDSGLMPNYTHANFRDHKSENNYDINGSISFQPFSWLTTYAAWDRDTASGDCACCLTMGYTSPYLPGDNQYTINKPGFRLKSTLREFGAKAELIPNKLFASVAYYDQSRYNVIAASAWMPQGGISKARYQGYELALTYQPDKHLSAGANYSHLNVNPGGTTPDGANRHSFNAWGQYQFDSGFGVKASLWVTSEWKANGATIPSQYNLDLGAFYTYKRWRIEVDLLNATDQKNWTPSGGYAGDTYGLLLPAERLGFQGKVTYSF